MTSKTSRSFSFFKIDPRIFQIVTLSTLYTFLLIFSDYGPTLTVFATVLASGLFFQFLFYLYVRWKSGDFKKVKKKGAEKIFHAARDTLFKTDYKSPMISCLSLSILLKASAIWFFPLAAALAMGSKFFLRVEDKHIFNPTNIAIVVMLIALPNHVWISPGQWDYAIWFVFLLVCFAFLVLYKIPKGDIAFFFIGSYAALLVGRAMWLGAPLDVPFAQLQGGALIIFTFFMITDPKTTPNSRLGRFIFAFATALIGFIMQTEFYIWEGLFFALAMVSLTTPFIDKMRPAERYEWSNST